MKIFGPFDGRSAKKSKLAISRAAKTAEIKHLVVRFFMEQYGGSCKGQPPEAAAGGARFVSELTGWLRFAAPSGPPCPPSRRLRIRQP